MLENETSCGSANPIGPSGTGIIVRILGKFPSKPSCCDVNCMINAFSVRSPEFRGGHRLANNRQVAILNLIKRVFLASSRPTILPIYFIGLPCPEKSHFEHVGVVV